MIDFSGLLALFLDYAPFLNFVFDLIERFAAELLLIGQQAFDILFN